MSKPLHPSKFLHSSSQSLLKKQFSLQRLSFWQKAIVQGLILTSPLWGLVSPSLAAPAPPGPIDNTATGSFIDTSTDNTVNIFSNTVTLTVREVAGITVDPSGIPIDAPAADITSPSPFQGIAGINKDDVVYFYFTITNVGNDPTAFFIPGTATITGGAAVGTLENIQIIEVDPNGTLGLPNPKTVAVPLTLGTGGDTITLLGTTDGYIPVNGTVKVRVAVKVTETTVGNPITVTLGDTSGSAGTRNQPYLANGNRDLYTNDLANATANPYPLATFSLVSQVPETNGNPVNGEREASAAQSVNLAATPAVSGYKSVKLTIDLDNSSSITPGDTLTWRVSYANTGTVDVDNFQITDALPAGLTYSNALVPITITPNTTQGGTITHNASYDGTGNNTLFDAPLTFKAGGVITVNIPVTINVGVVSGTTFSNQSTATSDDLPAVGVKSDNIDNTNLPASLPTDVTVPASSIDQTQTGAIDPTIAKTFSASNPKLLLVKRITAINDVPITTAVNDGVALSDDDNANWITTASTTPITATGYLQGDITRNDVKPVDRLEYTIYFLSAGDIAITNVTICDLIPADTTFVNNAYDVVSGSSNRGIVFANSTITPTSYLTGLFDGDRAKFYPANTVPPTTCVKESVPGTFVPMTITDNTNGLVVVDVAKKIDSENLPPATTPVVTPNSYGFVRFTVKVN